ncbi:MAG: starch-binding protein [Prevotella sp.]|nr:starch-binding protein [Prevotella sp.]
MKRIFALFAFVLSAVSMPAASNVGGIPSGYGGVMLQAFYWNSYDDTAWANLENQADELCSFFDLIWVPQSGNCNGTSMGYMPYYWYNQNSSFGTESELRSMISTFKSKGTGTIADVVINHRNTTNWFGFASETYNGTTHTMYTTDVCRDDEGGGAAAQLNYDYSQLGDYDTGDDFAGARDLDHTGSHVQSEVKAYLDFLLNDLGYYGFRYDMVKGYGGYYTQIYNIASNPQFSVGECWDGTSTIESWIDATGKQSGAFDFPLKYELQNACNAGSGWNAVGDGGGLIDNTTYRRYAVTFVDNHDTVYRSDGTNDSGNECTNNILAANAFILAAPGTPCIFLSHWQNSSYKNEIKKMIHARKMAGMTNTGDWKCGWWSSSSWSGIGTGTYGNVFVVLGNNTSSGSTVLNNVDLNDYFLITSGTNYAFYVSKSCNSVWPSVPSGSYSGSVTLNAVTNTSGATIVYTLDGTDPTANSNTCTDGGSITVSNQTLKAGLLVNGSVVGITTRYYGAMDGSGATNSGGSSTSTGLSIAEGEQAVFFENSAGWSTPIYAYIWDTENGKTHEFTASWPGDQESNVSGNVWKYTYTGSETIPNDGSTGIIFDDGTNQTADLVYVNGGYYNASGYQYTVPTVSSDSGSASSDGTWVAYFTDNYTPAWSTPYVWIWDNADTSKNYTGGTWPGKPMTQQSDGMWVYTFTTTDNITTPMIIFNDGDANGSGTIPAEQTADMSLTNYGHYNRDGLIEVLVPEEEEEEETGINAVNAAGGGDAWYTLQGIRIASPTRSGVYIKNGRKVVIK